MPLNIPGLLAPFQLLFQPRLVIPGVIVKDIRHIDFSALKRAGYRGAVFDKDNCLTMPHQDTLVPELRDSWKQCRDAFGEGNVLIVSNSAGTYLDAGGLQAESVSYHMGVPVLQHKSFKPAYSCITAIRTYFTSLRSPILDHELVIVGDRILTDVVLTNRMALQASRSKRASITSTSLPREKDAASVEEKQPLSSGTLNDASRGPLSIWTTGVWKKDSMLIRLVEREFLKTVQKWSTPPAGEPFDTSIFTKEVIHPEPLRRISLFKVLGGLISRLRGA